MPKKSVFSLRKVSKRLAELTLSGPLLTSFGLGLGFLLSEPDMFGPGHNALFEIGTAKSWGIVCVIPFFLGHYGRLIGQRRYWLWAHSLTTAILFIFGCCFLFTVLYEGKGGLTVALGILGLAFHSWCRSSGFHRDPFQKND